jgi:hyperosmotically inducible periplasmic protein
MIKPIALALLAVSTCALVGQANAQADNTRTNQSDSSNTTASADHQSNGAGDLNLTARIRKSVLADKSLSTYAHNVKIVAVNGNVTLNGVVRSDQEKSAIEMKAEAVAGKGNVVDDLKVAPAN